METRVEKPRRHKWIAAALALIMTMTVFLTALPPLPVGATGVTSITIKGVSQNTDVIIGGLAIANGSLYKALLYTENNVSGQQNGKISIEGNELEYSFPQSNYSTSSPFDIKISGDFSKVIDFALTFDNKTSDLYQYTVTSTGGSVSKEATEIPAKGTSKYDGIIPMLGSGEITVTISKAAAKHTVTLPADSTDFLVRALDYSAGTATVKNGESFEFYLYKRVGMGERGVNFNIIGSKLYEAKSEGEAEGAPGFANYSKPVKYKIENVTEDIIILMDPEPEKFKPTMECSGCTGFSESTVGADDSITMGDNYSFSITMKPGYGKPEVKVARGGSTATTLNPTGEGGDLATGKTYFYTVTSVKTNITITVTGDPIATYSVNWANGVEYSFTDKYKGDQREEELDNWNSVDYGTQVKFKIKMTEGYDPDQVVVLVNGTEVSKSTDEYYHFTVTGDTGISIRNGTAQKLKYNIDLHDQTEYSATASSTSVEYGQSFTFTITLAEGYTLAESAMANINVEIGQTRYTNCTIVDLKDGRYRITVKNVKNAGEVTIDAGQIETASYTITWPSSGTGYTISEVKVGGASKKSTNEVQTAKYNEKVEFKVNLNEGYTKSQYVVYINRTPQAKKSDGVYSFEVKGETTIEIEQVEKDTLVFTVQPAAGYTQSGNSNLTTKYGGSLTFEVTLEEGYGFEDEVKIQINGGEETSVQPQNISDTSRYTITLSEVTVNGEISFTDGSIKKKQITVTDYDGGKAESDNNKDYHYKLETLEPVNYGDRVSVHVSALSGWKISQVQLVNEQEVVQQELSKGSGDLWQTTVGVTDAYKVKVTCNPITIKVNLTHGGQSGIKESYNVDDDKENAFLSKDDEEGKWYLKLPAAGNSDVPVRTGFKFKGWKVSSKGKDLEVEPMAILEGDKYYKYEIAAGDDVEFTIDGQWDYDPETLFTLNLSCNGDVEPEKLVWTTNINITSGVDEEGQAELGELLKKWNGGFKILGYGCVYSTESFDWNDAKDKVNSLTGKETDGSLHYYFYGTSQDDGWELTNNIYTQKFGYKAEQGGSRYCMTFIKVEINSQSMVFHSDVVSYGAS